MYLLITGDVPRVVARYVVFQRSEVGEVVYCITRT